MQWELAIVVSVYNRDDWVGGLKWGQGPIHEKMFTSSPLPNNDQSSVLQAMTQCRAECEGWLNKIRPSLWTTVVVTTYSLEVCNGSACGCNRD